MNTSNTETADSANDNTDIEGVSIPSSSHPALDRLEELAKSDPSYVLLASLLSEDNYKKYDVSSRITVGKLRASGGYADVYEGRLLTGTIGEEASSTQASTCRFSQANLPNSKKIAVKRFRVFVDQEGNFVKVSCSLSLSGRNRATHRSKDHHSRNTHMVQT